MLLCTVGVCSPLRLLLWTSTVGVWRLKAAASFLPKRSLERTLEQIDLISQKIYTWLLANLLFPLFFADDKKKIWIRQNIREASFHDILLVKIKCSLTKPSWLLNKLGRKVLLWSRPAEKYLLILNNAAHFSHLYIVCAIFSLKVTLCNRFCSIFRLNSNHFHIIMFKTQCGGKISVRQKFHAVLALYGTPLPYILNHTLYLCV